MPASSRALRICSVLALVISSIGGGAAVASTNSPVGPPGSGAIDQYIQSRGTTFLDDQNALSDFKHWITSQPGIEQAGYVDQVNDATTRSTKLLWKGPSPLRAVVLAEGQRRGIGVTFSERPYSLPEIKAAVSRLDAQKAALSARGFQIEGIVGVRDDDGAISVEGHALSGQSPDMKAVASAASGIAQATVRLVDSRKSTPATRSNDVAPFNAGDYMTITARHCPNESYYDRDNSGVYVGYEFRDSPDGQASLIDGTGSWWMYDGAWDNPYGYSKQVVGFQDVSLGDWICTSGGNSGVHCSIQVTSMYYWWNDGYGGAYNIEAYQTNSADIAAIQGDSGGPVLMPYSSGTTVGAVGMIQAVLNGWTGNCGSVHDGGGNVCSRDFLFTSTRTIANSLGMNLVT